MPKIRQTFQNRTTNAMDVVVEPIGFVFTLRPLDELALTWDAAQTDQIIQIDYIAENFVAVWPGGEIGKVEHAINGVLGPDIL